MNIPIYRAKKIDSDEYAVGYYTYNIDNGLGFIWEENIHKVDITTLAIHFPDMLDSQGNKIFASLSEDGKGGDILEYKKLTNKMFFDGREVQTKITYCKFATSGFNILTVFRSKDNDSFKVIGIQQ